MKRFLQKLSTFARKREGLVLGGIIAGFLLLSFGNLARWSVWFDEAFGAYMIRYSYADIGRFTASDVHPPLYYWALKAWTSVFGTSEIGLRSLSLVCVAIAIIFVYLTVRRLFGRRAATLAAFFSALSPMLLRYSEEARMYGMAAMIVAAATYALVLLQEKVTYRRAIAYGLLVALGMLTHYYTILMWVAHWVWKAAAEWDGSWRRLIRRFTIRPWLLAHGVALVAFLPWLFTMVKQMGQIQHGGFWIKPITIVSPVNALTNLLLYKETWETTSWLAILVLAVLVVTIIAMVRLWPRLAATMQKRYLLLLILSLAPVLLLLGLSLPPLRPSFVERYLIPAYLYTAVLLGVSIALAWRYRQRATSGLLACLVAVAMIMGAMNVYATGNYNKNNGDLLQIRWTVREAQRLAGNEPMVISAFRYYEGHYYETDNHPMYYQAADGITWGSFDMMRFSEYRKVHNVAEFAKQHGGTIWFLSDWNAYGKPAKPETGNWKVLAEIHAPALPNDKAGLRAVQLQLVP